MMNNKKAKKIKKELYAVKKLAQELFEVCCYPDPTKWKDTDQYIWKLRAQVLIDSLKLKIGVKK